MARKKNEIITNLKCEECDNVSFIPRTVGDLREKGHVKDFWCFKCKKETKHRDFIYEYDVIGTFALSKDEIQGLNVKN